MSVINSSAQNVAERMAGLGADREAALDPTTIFMIADIIFELLDRCRELRSANSMHEAMRNPGWMARRSVKRAVIRNLGRRGYRNNGGREMVQAILAEGAHAKLADVETLYHELDD